MWWSECKVIFLIEIKKITLHFYKGKFSLFEKVSRSNILV
jgi:hypothetical protein